MASQTFQFTAFPNGPEVINSLPKFKLDSPYKTSAIALLVLYNFESNPDFAFKMLDVLKGPDSVSQYEMQFIKERLTGKDYKVRSFFAGATPENNYQPSMPLTITVEDNPYSFQEENWATMFVKSSGADSPRQIKLRKKPSTGEWFITELQCLSDIRVPVAADPWA